MVGMRHWDDGAVIAAPVDAVFAFLDDHARLAAHMSRSSWMMGGGRMELSVDAGGGQVVGSHIRLDGTVLGVRLALDEVVTRREPPVEKVWETVGAPRLLVVGPYIMGFRLAPRDGATDLRLFIDYDLPETNQWLGQLFGGVYARWCVGEMLTAVRRHFAPHP